MLLRQMEYFRSVVELNSFTKAAELCNVSQSAISQQIQALEAELGAQLLSRHGRSFTLTPAGEHFYRRSLFIMAELERLRQETRRIHRAERETLRLGCLVSYDGGEFQNAIAAFSQRCPEVEVQVTAGNHEDLYQGLLTGTMDLVLNDQRRAFDDAYENLVLAESRCCVELATFSPLSHLDTLEISDLQNTPCVLIASEAQADNERDYYRDILGFRGEILFAESLQAARVLVVANRAVMPVDLVGAAAYPGPAIRRVPLTRQGKPILRRLCAFRRKENAAPAVLEFQRLLTETFK